MKNNQAFFPRYPWLAMAAVLFTLIFLQMFSNWLLYGLFGFEQAAEIDQSRALVTYLIVSFVVVPHLLYLPYGSKGLVPMIEEIKLFQDRPAGRLLWMAVSSYLILAFCQVVGVLVLHSYQGGMLDFGFLQSTFSTAGKFSTMTFMLAFPPILEEVVFRGVVLTTFRNKYGPTGAVIFSSLGYGLVQLILFMEGQAPIIVAEEVVGAFLMGIFYGAMYLRSGSLLPNILFHYLNGLLGAYLTGYLAAAAVPQSTRLLFEFVFSNGVIPVVLMVLWVFAITRRIEEKRKQDQKTSLVERLETLSRGE